MQDRHSRPVFDRAVRPGSLPSCVLLLYASAMGAASPADPPDIGPPASGISAPVTSSPAFLVGQFGGGGELPPVPMPPDRAADSYRIYSVLMPVGELAQPGWPRNLWLLSDTTVSLVAPNESCASEDDSGMNPHRAVAAPADRQHDLQEMLDDFDRRCHERIHLTPESFNLVAPLRLLSPAEQEEFIRVRFDPSAGPEGDLLTAKYKGAPGLSRFSEVYFNAHHTVAMVYAGGWCGDLCAQSYWHVLELQDGLWRRLEWRTTSLVN